MEIGKLRTFSAILLRPYNKVPKLYIYIYIYIHEFFRRDFFLNGDSPVTPKTGDCRNDD